MMNNKRTENRETLKIGRLQGRLFVPEQKQMYLVEIIYLNQYKL